MKNGKYTGTLRMGALATAVFLLGCAKSPDAELATARAAIESARQAGAEKSAPSAMLEATHFLDSALQEIDARKKEFLGGDFANARRLLLKAGDKAREAGAAALRATIEQELQAKAAGVKDTVRADSLSPDTATGPAAATATLNGAKSAINLTYAGYQKARKEAGPDAKAALESILKGLKEARAAMQAKDYAKALKLAEAAKAQLDSLPR